MASRKKKNLTKSEKKRRLSKLFEDIRSNPMPAEECRWDSDDSRVYEDYTEPCVPVDGGMRVKTYNVLSEAVERGIESGWRHAHKYSDRPSEDAIRDKIYLAVTAEICEYFYFPEVPEGEV